MLSWETSIPPIVDQREEEPDPWEDPTDFEEDDEFEYDDEDDEEDEEFYEEYEEEFEGGDEPRHSRRLSDWD